MHIFAYNDTMSRFPIFFFILIALLMASPDLRAIEEDEKIEGELSNAILSVLQPFLKASPNDSLSDLDQAHLLFLKAIRDHDSDSREQAKKLYSKINSPFSRARLGAIELLEARDFGSNGFVHFLGSFTPIGLVRLSHVHSGISLLDKAVNEAPEDLDVLMTRAQTYLNAPAIFGKFPDGVRDINFAFKKIEESAERLPKCERFFRDQTAFYYLVGLFRIRDNDLASAQKMFTIAAERCPESPFAIAAKKRTRPQD